MDLGKRAYLVFFELIHRAASCRNRAARRVMEMNRRGLLGGGKRAWRTSDKVVCGAAYAGHDIRVLTVRMSRMLVTVQMNGNEKMKGSYIVLRFYTSDPADPEPMLRRVRS